jgi:hypothetical protein
MGAFEVFIAFLCYFGSFAGGGLRIVDRCGGWKLRVGVWEYGGGIAV